MRKILFPFFFLLSLLPGLIQAQTQECSMPGYEEALSRANVVLEAQVADMQTNWVSSGYKVVFKVDRSWKRSTEPFTTVNIKREEYCPNQFEKGKSYLVFVDKGFALQTGCCYRVLALDEAGEDLAQLGEGIPVGHSPGASMLPIIMTIMTVLGLGLVAFVVLRKKKAQSQTASGS